MELIFYHIEYETVESAQFEMSEGQSPALSHAYHTYPPTIICDHDNIIMKCVIKNDKTCSL